MLHRSETAAARDPSPKESIAGRQKRHPMGLLLRKNLFAAQGLTQHLYGGCAIHASLRGFHDLGAAASSDHGCTRRTIAS